MYAEVAGFLFFLNICVTHPQYMRLINLTHACLTFLPSIQLYVSQPFGAGAAGENPGQPPGSGPGLLQQRAMSMQPPDPNTAITQPQAQPSPLCQPSSFSVPKLSLCLLISTTQDGYLRTPSLSQSLCNEMFAFVNVIVDFIVTAREDFLWLGQKKSTVFTLTDTL